MSELSHQVLTELLVLRAQNGCADSVGLLVRLWRDRLWRHACRLTGVEDAAEDVLQDAWIDVVRGLHGLDDPNRFGPWAYRIVTRRCALWVRQKRRRSEVERDAGDEMRTSASDRASTNDSDAVQIAFRRLSADQRAILELRYVENFSIPQIAEALDVADGTVKSRLFHARNRLRDVLKEITQ
jgi:RNA polymerase sigma-70 factor (ECF subfamily)